MTQRHKILITGANGLLGYRLCEILAADYDVHALVRRAPQDPLKGATYHEIDLSQNWSTDQLPDNLDTIIHLAQSSHFRDFPDKAQDIFDVNISSTARLLDYAYKTGTKRFIYASSGGVYKASQNSIDENAPLVAHSNLGYYMSSKLTSEIFAQNYSSLLTVGILRFFFIYGARQNKTMLIPRLIENIKQGNPITLQGEEGLRINPIHVNDAAIAVQNSLNLSESCTFNVAGDDVLSLKQLSEIIGRELGIDPIFEYQDTSPSHLVADNGMMKSLAHTPEISFSQGIRDLI